MALNTSVRRSSCVLPAPFMEFLRRRVVLALYYVHLREGLSVSWPRTYVVGAVAKK
jgi:hypothetical protein